MNLLRSAAVALRDALARRNSKTGSGIRATGGKVSSGRVGRWALLAALFVSGCRGVDPIDRAGWFAFCAGFLVGVIALACASYRFAPRPRVTVHPIRRPGSNG